MAQPEQGRRGETQGQRSVGRPRASYRAIVEALEARALPVASALPAFLAASGFGATGQYAAIHPNAIATDSAGNSVVVGSFRSTASFAGGAATATTSNTQDTFVGRFGPSGNLLWLRTFAGRATTSGSTTTYATGQGTGVAIDGSGNIVVTGSFTGTVNFGTASSPNVLSSPLSDEAYVTKLDPAGNLVWVRNVVGSGQGDEDTANALTLDASGGAIIAGTFCNSLTVGATTLTASGASEAFAARYDAAGNVVWAVASHGTTGSNAQATAVALDPAGNVALAGFFSGSLTLGSGTATTTVTSQGSTDALVWKLSSAGALVWGRSFGGTDYDAANAIGTDSAGNVLVAGTFTGTAHFGTTAAPVDLTTPGIFDPFALKLSPAGVTGWADGFVSTGSSGWGKAQALAVDSLGQVHLAGTFSGGLDFDPSPSTSVLTSVGSNDAFVAGLTSGGGLVYSRQMGQTNFNAALGLAVNPSGLLALTGTYSGSITLGTTSLAAAGSAGVPSGFVVRLQTQPTHVPSAPVLEAGSTTGTTNVTSVQSPILDVLSADATDTVTLLRDGAAVGSRLGPGAITDPGPVPRGTHQYTAIETSLAGLSSLVSPATSVQFVNPTPAAPTGLGLLAADDSGTLGDGITNVRTPRLVGLASAGLTVQISNATTGVVLGSGTASSNGTFTIAIGPLTDGTYSLQAVAVDPTGPRSSPSALFTLVILTATPAAPTGLGLLAADDSGTLGDGITNVRTPRLVGLASAGLTVQISNATTGVVLGSGTVNSNGTFTIAIGPLTDGTYSLQAVAVDLAGNRSAASTAFALRILTAAPATPTTPSLLAADDSGTLGDGITNVRAPRLTTTAPAGTVVTLLNASNVVVATAAAASTGLTTLTITPGLADGTYLLRALATDVAGNSSSPSAPFTLVILTAAPAAPKPPVLLAADDTGVIGDGMTTVRLPRLAGTVGAGWRVDWIGPDGSVVATTTAGSDGSYTLQPANALPQGLTTVRVRATDLAGNVGGVSNPFNLTIRVTTGDFLGTSTANIGVYRPSTSTFYIQPTPGASLVVRQLGLPGDIPVPGDFFGNGHNDVAVFRPSTATFYYLDPVTGASGSLTWGAKGDLPAVGDYDGDGKTDIAIFRPSTGSFFIYQSRTGTFAGYNFGQSGDIPVPGDYFGDGTTDLAIFRPSTATFFIVDLRTGAFTGLNWGSPGDIPVPGDYDGDGKTDVAVFRPSTATFFAYLSGSRTLGARQLGSPNDVPIPGDYFGQGRSSWAIFHTSTATFVAVDPVSNALLVQQFGATTDKPFYPPLISQLNGTGTAFPSRIIGTPVSPPTGGSGQATTPEFVPTSAATVVVAATSPTRPVTTLGTAARSVAPALASSPDPGVSA